MKIEDNHINIGHMWLIRSGIMRQWKQRKEILCIVFTMLFLYGKVYLKYVYQGVYYGLSYSNQMGIDW